MSGWQLPKVEGKESKDKGEIVDPYVKVKLIGAPSDKKSLKTKKVRNNGFNPSWNQELKFPVAYPELAILYFKVSDADLVLSNDMLGQYVLPLNCIREGYRSVPLKDKNGSTYEKASLLVHVKWT